MATKLEKSNVEEIIELNTLQKGMLYHYLREEENNLYNVQLSLRIEGPLNTPALEQALQVLLARNEALRSVFSWEKTSKPVQIILKASPLPLRFHDLSAKDTADSAALVEAWSRADWEERFDLTDTPLRIALIKEAPDSHILNITHHHILYDGWSTGIFLKELFFYYHRQHTQGKAELPAKKTYKEICRALRINRNLTQEEQYWKQYLDGYELQAFFSPAQALMPPAADTGSFRMACPLAQLTNMARDFRVTPAAIIYTAYGLLLQKLHNLPDVVFGTTVSGRDASIRDSAHTIGNFINTIPLRLREAGDKTLRELVLDVNMDLIDRNRYNVTSSYEINQWMNLKAEQQLFDSVVVIENYPLDEQWFKESAELQIKLRAVREKTDIPLLLTVFLDKEAVFEFTYQPHIIDDTRARAFAGHFLLVLNEIINRPYRKLRSLCLLTEAEKQQLLYAFNANEAAYPSEQAVHELFEAQCAGTPDKIAIEYEGKAITYKELDRHANSLAALLREKGLQPEGIVGIFLERSPELIISILGALKAGGCYMPIDPDLPNERISHLLADSQCKLLITGNALLPRLQQLETFTGQLMDLNALNLASLPGTRVENSNSPGDLAYVLYTSGTTGKPKGVMVEHRSLLNYTCWAIQAYIDKEDTCFPLYTSVSFDLTLTSIFVPLLSGNKILIYGQEGNDLLVERVIRDNKVDIIKLTPSHLKLLRDKNILPADKASRIKKWIVGGEELPAALAMAISEQFGGDIRVYNEYGPTEATVGCMIYTFSQGDPWKTVPIGRAISNNQVYALDRHLQPLPPGAPGELYIAGDSLARGYLFNEALTAQKFVNNPFIEGRKMYRTGDLVRHLSPGVIEFIGRNDRQVKLKGFRIELAEIEGRLLGYQGITDAIVKLTSTENNTQCLSAYYKSSAALDETRLREHLAAMLPHYMIPAHLIRISDIPLTRNGKINYGALPLPGSGEEAQQALPPSNELEQLLVNVWQQVLGIARLGITDNFFDLGGDSIKSIQISSRIRTAGYELSVKDIFTYQTIQKLALRLEEINTTADQSPVTGSAFLTPVQQLFFNMPFRERHHFNQSVLLHFSEGLNSVEAGRIFGKIQEHHDALRMVYREEDGTLIQLNRGLDLPLALVEFDLRKEDDAPAKLRDIAEGVQSGIDLANGPLMKIGLFQLEEGASLLIVIHHLVVDGISWRILFEDIEALYQQVKNGSPLRLPLKSDAFLSWSGRLLEYTRKDAFRKTKAWWSEALQQPWETIPRDFPNGANIRSSNQRLSFHLSEEDTASLLTKAHTPFNTRINDILLAALALALQKQYGNTKPRIELEGHGREEMGTGFDASRTIGWFTSIYPLILASETNGPAALIKQVKERLRAIPNNGADYLLYLFQEQGNGDNGQISFNYLGQFDADLSGRSYTVQYEAGGNEVSPHMQSPYDWSVIGAVMEQRLGITLLYSTDQYLPATVAAFMATYQESLLELIDYCCSYDKIELTPSDLSYPALPQARLDELQQEYALTDVYPLSPMQEGILFHSLLSPDSDHYFQQVSCRIDGNPDIAAVERSMNDLAARYEVLRTVFLNAGQRPMQLVLQERKIDFSYKDVRAACSAGMRETVMASYRSMDRGLKFRLDKDALLRLLVLRTGESEYEFIWSHHHIIMDGWCMGIILRDFREAYALRKQGAALAAAGQPRYGEYISWLANRDLQAADTYWKDYLQSYDQLAGLPKKEVRAAGNVEPATHRLLLDAAQTKALTAISGAHGVTLSNILYAAWALLLAKYNNVKDVVFGSVVSGRPAEISGIENMVGLFINTVPVRISYEEDTTIGDLLEEVQARSVRTEAYSYHSLPAIQALSGLGSGLLDHIMVIENYPVPEQVNGADVAGDYRITDVQVFEQTNYDLSLIVVPGKEIQVNFAYDARQYDAWVIEAAARHLSRIITQISTDTRLKLTDIDMLAEDEKHTLLHALDHTADVTYPADKTLYQLFKEQAERFPDKTALVFNDTVLTYQELDRRATTLAAILRARGVGPDVIVGLLTDRSLETVIGMLAILRAGGAYLPIDVDYPIERKQYLVKDSGTNILLTSRGLDTGLGLEIPAIYMDDLPPAAEAAPEIPCINKPSDLCYIIYTSGTTGHPKGVMVEHGNVVRLLFNSHFQFDFGAEDVWTMFHSHCFDFSVWEIYGALLFGGRLVIIPKMVARDTGAYLGILKREKVTVLNQTPSAFYNLVKEELAGPAGGLQLRYIIFGGEALSPEKLKDWKARYPTAQLINMFGITETTVHVTYKEIGDHEIAHNIHTVGKPIPTLYTYVLDARQRLVPRGVVGELYVGGAGVSRGYLGKEELTAVKFIADPYRAGQRLYRSGDLGRLMGNGELEYMGRMDDQVKIRGFRIELGEIESLLNKQEQVIESAVVTKVRNGDKCLVAYYVADKEISVAALRGFLSAKLPDYMVPAYYVRLDKLPLTFNGKLDRKALPEPEFGLKTGKDYLAPRTEEELLLVEIWSKVLAFEGIGINDNFFALGGDSIKSLQIISRMRSAGFELSVKDLFVSQDIQELALKVKPLQVLSDQSIITGTAPLSPIQQWFFASSVEDKHHYNQSALLHFPAGLTSAAATLLLGKLLEHHDALRMTFRKENGQLLQENWGLNRRPAIEEHDLRDAEDPAAALLQIANGIQAGMDLRYGPLLKTGLFHMNDGSRLLIVVHHLVVDAVSWRILYEDIDTLCTQLEKEEELRLPPKTDAFLLWPAKLQEYTRSEAFQEARKYWEHILAKPFATISRDFPNEHNRLRDNKIISFSLDQQDTMRLLKDAHARFHTNTEDLLLAALSLALNKLYGISNLRIDLEGHGREDIGMGINISRTVGWFTSIYPVLLETGDGQLPALVKQVKETLRRVPNRGIDYLLLPAEHNNRSRLIFNYLGQFDDDIQGRPFTVTSEARGFENALDEIRMYDWDLSAMVSGGHLQATILYSSEQYTEEHIQRLMSAFKDQLLEIISYCCAEGHAELTPSDLTWKQLPADKLNELQRRFELEDVYPLSPMQEGLLFHASLHPQSDHYFQQMACKISGSINMGAIERSMNDLLQRHPVLRALFLQDVYDRPLQVVLRERKVDFRILNIAAELETAGEEQVLRAYLQEDRSKKFDLSRDVLMRLTVLQMADTEFYFIWSYHHILMDGWCMGIIVRELREIYMAHCRQLPHALPPVKPYGRYISWLAAWNGEAALHYWKRYLAGYNSMATLPHKETGAGAALPYRLATETLLVTKEHTARLHGLSVKYGVTLNVILQAAWGLLLGKYNHVTDVVFAAVVSGRPAEIEGVESMIGLFINTIPVRVRYKATDTVEALLKALQQDAISSNPHQYSLLPQVQAESGLGRSLFDHVMIFENYPLAKEVKGGEARDEQEGQLHIEEVRVFEQTNYDLSITIIPGDEILIRLDYNANVYRGYIVQQAAGHLQQVLLAMAADAVQPVGDIGIIAAEERHKLLYTFNDTQGAFRDTDTLVSLFEERVRQTPGKTAIVYEDTVLSYAQLHERSNRLAHLLSAQYAVKPNDFVGIMVERSEQMMIGLLGILKAGAAYIPLDPAYPLERIAYVLEDSAAAVLLTDRKLEQGISYTGALVSLDEISGQPATDLAPLNTAADPCYLIYTSGSTGLPKGVNISHSNVLNFIAAMDRQLPLQTTDCMLAVTSTSFDISVLELFWTLVNGVEVVIHPADILMNDLDRYMAAGRLHQPVTMMQSTPSFMKLAIDGEGSGAFLGSLRLLLLGGEAVPLALVNRLMAEYPAGIYNMYGPTETTIWSCVHKFEAGADSVSIGRPILNTQVYILDKQLQLLPPGVPGDLYIGGKGLAKGYWKRPALTAERFIENPFDANALIYRTGDIARWLEDGSIELAGREDQQVKIRGYRIEPGEIEHQLSAFDTITDAAVVAVEKDGEPSLVAYYVGTEDLPAGQLKAFLLKKLPAYMVPAAYVRLAEMPLTPNGKTDRKALLAIKIEGGEYVAPTGETEVKIAEIWSDILKIEKELIGANDDFFLLGGHSLTAVAAVNRIKKAFGCSVPLNIFLDNATVAEMARFVSAFAYAGDEIGQNENQEELIF
jgi:amino acid adenylation domain-containing protein/non-ribosomal peptide synthase protein (TIGR01720 family)